MNSQSFAHNQNIEDVFPMSDIEKGMVYHTLKDPSSFVYHDQTIFQIKFEGFDQDIFERAFDLMVEKHPNLRSYFDLFDFDEPVQIVCRHLLLDIEYHDYSRFEPAKQREAIKSFSLRDRQQPFDFSKAQPLWRMRTFALGDDNYCFMWVNHHAIADGWSTASLMTELYNTYHALKNNPQFVPKKLKSSYKDFVIEQVIEKKNKQHDEFWKKELAGYKRFEFPRPIQPIVREGNKTYARNFGDRLLRELSRAAKQYDSSLKNLCFAAYVYMLNMLSFENDLVVGLVTNNRPQCEDGDKIFGCFLNTVPVRVNIPDTITWREYIRLIDNKLLELANHNRLPLHDIVKIIGEETQDRNPIFDTFFNYVDFHVYGQAGAPAENGHNSDHQTSVEGIEKTNTLFDFHVNTTAANFYISFSYSTAIISDELAANMGDYFENVLRKFFADPHSSVNKLDLLTEAEKKKLLHTFNHTAEEYPKNKLIHKFFEEQAKKNSDHVAVIFKDCRVSFKELNSRANQLAWVLKTKGVGADSIVAIMIEPSIERMLAILAIVKAGGAYLPIEPDFPESRIQYLLKDSGTSFLLTRRRFITFSINNCEILDVEDPVHYQGNTADPKAVATSRNLIYVMYTSGSTGNPKGVLTEHQALVNRLLWMQKQYPLDGQDVVLQKTFYTFDVSVWELFWWSIAGATLCFLPDVGKRDPRIVVETIERNGVTTLHYVPSMLNIFMDFIDKFSDARRLSSLRQVFASGEALAPAHVQKFNRVLRRANDTRLTNLYGPTEAAIDVSYFDLPDAEEVDTIPIGKPIANTRFFVVNKSQQLQPLGVPGELCIAGDGLARDYLGRGELSREKFTPNPFFPGERVYKTGDLVRWRADGNLEFLGRIDTQVKIRGIRIELGEIESQLLRYPKIKEAVVILKEDQHREKYLCAYVVSDFQPMVSELRDHLLTQLPEFMLPSHFVQVRNIPLTSNDKVDRKALLKLDDPMKSGAEFVAPQTGVEKIVADIWKQVLKVDKVGIHDNFFHVGGDSLSIIKVNNSLKQTFHKDIPVALMFKYHTINALAKFLSAQESDPIRSDDDIDASLKAMIEATELLVEEQL